MFLKLDAKFSMLGDIPVSKTINDFLPCKETVFWVYNINIENYLLNNGFMHANQTLPINLYVSSASKGDE